MCMGLALHRARARARRAAGADGGGVRAAHEPAAQRGLEAVQQEQGKPEDQRHGDGPGDVGAADEDHAVDVFLGAHARQAQHQ
eukprot:CAMPEP_0194701368 /NCGR_PEP_ID=MMETSP0295-20121207/26183_1 /TAXON_ID=39354 /ORGANISM="Heterosigma akashiwo, Strain CCMP2393" /LENGTH=82 /DNA_ID=CAMNT_0039595623 /DNA_START=46 /DNA_END=294 /DNA_ORIENTATION=+